MRRTFGVLATFGLWPRGALSPASRETIAETARSCARKGDDEQGNRNTGWRVVENLVSALDHSRGGGARDGSRSSERDVRVRGFMQMHDAACDARVARDV